MIKRLYTLVCIWGGIFLSFGASAQLVADFTSNIVSGCSPIHVQFTDQSTGNPTSWQWNLGNGTISTLQNPSTTYITPGTYTVTLTVSNGSGTNTKTITNYIQVVASPQVNFTSVDSVTCPPKAVQFTNLSVPGAGGTTTYLWDFGDGGTSTQVNPTHTYVANGVYNVSLSVTNSSGCSNIYTKPNYIQIVSKPTANFTASNNNSCTLPLNVSFTNTSTGGVSYLWNFGDGGTSAATSPNHTYLNPGSYTVTLVTTNAAGCKDTMVKNAFVNIGSLTASFTKSASTACMNNLIGFTNTSLPGPGNSTWYFGDGSSTSGVNATHAYTAPGTYTVMLVVNYNNCSDTTTQTVTINPGPTANFSANNLSGCSVPFTTSFSNTSSGATGYLWNFGDGTTSTATNPSHTYTSMGVYTVTLIAYGNNGCSDTFVRPAYINLTLPSVSITATSSGSCAPATYTLTANVPPGITITNYNWTFGDGSTSTTGPTVTHTYAAGSYTVGLTLTTSTGCTIVAGSIHVNVGNSSTAGFSIPSSACPNQVINFTNTSTIPAGATPIYSWTFGDGGTSNLANPSYSYSAQGTYTVTLTVNINGCISTYTSTIIIHPPKAQISVAYSCTNKLQASFTNTSTGGTTYLWDFGDGTTSTLQNPPPHVYANYGTYTVTLTVTNLPSGCVSTHTIPVNLFDVNPVFTADDTTVCKHQTVNFTATPSPYYATAVWNFGDGATGSAIPTAHAYSSTGVFTVLMITSDIHGCQDTFIRPNYISVTGPVANFSGAPTSGCAPLTVSFTDQSSSTTGISSRLWRFGDGSTSTANVANVQHTYGPGIYSVSLTITDANGCTDSLMRNNYITAIKPVANFTASATTVCPGQTMTFNNSSTGSNLSYQWSFGDGNVSTVANPTHSYVNTGTYTVRLIVTDGTSCSDTLVRTAYITVGGINLSFTASDTFANCPPLTVNFTNTSSNVSTYNWTFGNGNASSLPSPSTIYTVPGVYTVKLKGQNGACMDSVTKTITVLGPTGTFSYTPITGCAPLTVQFSSVNQNTQQLIWDMNNGVTFTTSASTTSYTYTAPGNYVPKLLLSDGTSCVVPIQGIDTIRVDKVIADFSFSPTNVCISGPVQFTDTILFNVNPVVSRSWTFGDGGTSNAHNPTHIYNTPGTYTVTLIVATSQGCMDTVVKTVTIHAAPTVSAGNNVSVCQGTTTPVQLQATGANSYVWTPAIGLSCTNCANPTTLPVSTTTYTVVGTGANGCMDTAQVTVTVNPLPVIQKGPNPSICEGASIQLAVTGAATYSWSPATGLSCTNCSNPTASPASTTVYTVTGTSTAGCSDSVQITVNVISNPIVTAITSKDTMCAGDFSSLQASGATSYVWSPAAGLSCTTCPNPVANPAVTTTYTVTGISGACSDTAMVTITVNPLPATTVPSQSVCIGSSVQLQATGAATYSWTPATGLSCTNCSNPIANPTSTTTYTITGTSVFGCVNTTQTTVTVNPLPVVSAGNDQTTCEGTAVNLQAIGATGYQWSPATGLSCTGCPNPSATPSITTVYTVIGTDANGCKDTDRVIVNVNPRPLVNAGTDRAICKFGTVALQATGASSYSWTPSSSLSCNNCPNPVASPLTPTSYVVIGTDVNGCTGSDTITVNIHPQPSVDAGSDQTICAGASTVLQASGGNSYLWSPATGLSCVACSSPTASPSSTTTYTVVGKDINGCSDTDRVVVKVIQKLPITFSKDDTLCEGESLELSASGGDQYFWSPAESFTNPNASRQLVKPQKSTTYSVVIKQGSCFTDTGKIRIIVRPKPVVNAGPDQRIIAGNSVNLFANGSNIERYSWSPPDNLSCTDCMNPVASPLKTTNYTVEVTSNFGCTATDDVTIFITCDNSQVFIPNTFTPNGDGNNDRFYPHGRGLQKINSFRVYSRWGELIYETRNFQPGDEIRGWDGTYKGVDLNPDVFVWIIDAVCYNGEPMQMKGDISLIR